MIPPMCATGYASAYFDQHSQGNFALAEPVAHSALK